MPSLEGWATSASGDPSRRRASARLLRMTAECAGPTSSVRSIARTLLTRLDPHRLDVEILLDVLLAGLAAVAAHLVAAERHRGVHRLIAVDPDRACAKRLGDAVRLADVAGPDAAAQS